MFIVFFRFSFQDPFFQEMFNLTIELDEAFENFSPLDMFTIAKYLPSSKTQKLLVKLTEVFLQYIETTYQEHLDTFDKGKVSVLKVPKRPHFNTFVHFHIEWILQINTTYNKHPTNKLLNSLL